FARAGNTMYLGQVLGNMGRLRTSMHRYDEAKMYLDSSMKTLAPMGPEFLIAPRIGLTELYGARGDHALAIETGEALRSFADSSGTLTDAKNLYLLLYEAYKAQGNTALALERYEHARELIDSLTSDENKSGMLRQEYKYSYDKRALSDSLSYAADMAIQQKEVQKQKVVRNGFIGGFVLVAVFAGVFFFQRNRIGREKARSEALLLNILPAEVAEELKAKGEAEAVQIDQVTVLFTDFKGFTAMSETMGPRELVRDLNECFSAFDAITSKYGIEKIKTIGDAYMAAGGLPTPNTTHATDVIKAALEMRDFIAAGKATKIAARQPYFEIRIGVHTGPVVAGIVGVKKFQYDIWGDTVNTASRMESSGEVGKVNISESTYAVMKDVAGFSFTPRGKVQAKGKGEMEMYFVESIG
ncbi:MAG: adenylate/guanylate cyclase domain-containing protein, partial [Flavobacteriales bacterium]